MQALRRAHLQVKTDLTALEQVLEWFSQFKGEPIPDIVWMQCELALAEGFTNAVHYAHRDKPALLIDLELAIFAEWLEIRVWDFGAPFNLHRELRERLLKEFLHGVDVDSERGRGIKLMWKIADLLRYTRTSDDRNCLLILKLYSLEH